MRNRDPDTVVIDLRALQELLAKDEAEPHAVEPAPQQPRLPDADQVLRVET